MTTHRDYCKQTAFWLLEQSGIDLVSWELKYVRGVYDVIGVTSKEYARVKKLVAIEVKRTRSDLLQDLRKRKMLKYEARATHCYLAATPEALRLHKLTTPEALADLKTRGLPTYWGVLVLTNNPLKPIRVLRGARKHKSVQSSTIRTLTRKIGRSWMYRIMSPCSPVTERTITK